MKVLLPFIIALCAFSSAHAQTFNPLLAQELQDTLDKYVTSIPNIKGMSASVYLPGHGVWTGTHGVSHAGTPIAGDMLFGIASNTKLFVAATMLKLAEDGVLSLDDSLHKWIDSYPNINPNITIRQLLNHTSGISDPLFVAPYVDTLHNNPTRVFTPDEVIRWVGAPLFLPGNGWGYSNINYVIAGLIAERATGHHISKLIRDYILTPLELGHTLFDVKEYTPGQQAPGPIAHRWFNGIDYHDTSRVGLNTAGASAGAIFSTSDDMVRWYHALLSGNFLDSTSFAELTNFVATPGAYTYGLGLERQPFFGNTVWGHGGATWGYRSRMVYDPVAGAAVAGLTNSWPSGVDGVTLLLYKVLVDRLPSVASAITGPSEICRGQRDVTYATAPIAGATSYEWTLPYGAQGSSTTTSITVHFMASALSGDVTVRGVNAYGEGVASTTHVTANNKPPTPIITRKGDTLFSSSPTGNQWYNAQGKIVGATLQRLLLTTGDTYYVIVSSPKCVSDTSARFVYVPGTSEITGLDTVCQGERDVMYATTPMLDATLYVWTLPHGAEGSSTTTSIVVQFSDEAVNGVITVRGFNDNGGVGITTKSVIVHPRPSTPSIARHGDTLVSSSSTGNQWYNGQGKIDGATMQTYLPTPDNIYYVIVADMYCDSDTSEPFEVFLFDGVEDDLASEVSAMLRLYPNPFADELVVSVGDGVDGSVGESTVNKATISIVNALGQVVYTGAYTNDSRIRTSDYAPGVYLVVFEVDGVIACKAVVKE